VIHLNRSLLRTKQGRPEEAQELRKEATAALDLDSARPESTGISYLAASVLQKLGDYRRAIPFWEQAIHLADPNAESDHMASMLHKLGECYSRIGLKDHAVVPLRAALRLLKFCHEDPRRSATLITLGNALRKTAPAEAEACYKEVADLHQSRLEYEAATPAWGNLGVLCSEQRRFAEALDYFQKVQRIREQTRGTQGASLAITHNNIALCYMRMRRFTEAHESADHALQLLTGSDRELATVYSTKGMIYQESGDHIRAVDWLHKATDERGKYASPNLESMVDDLNREITCLKELGRDDEAAVAHALLARVHARMSEIPPSDCAFGAGKAPLAGCVTIEVNHAGGYNNPPEEIKFKKLQLSLMYDAEEEKTGHLSANFSLPGSRTLIFYGDDAEILYRVLEPRLLSNPIVAGATVTIRQRDSKREIILPGQSLH